MKSLILILLCVASAHALVVYEYAEANQRYTFHARNNLTEYSIFYSNRTTECVARRWTCWLNQEGRWSMWVSASGNGRDALLHTMNLNGNRTQFYFAVEDVGLYPSYIFDMLQTVELPGFTAECSAHKWRCSFATE